MPPDGITMPDCRSACFVSSAGASDMNNLRKLVQMILARIVIPTSAYSYLWYRMRLNATGPEVIMRVLLVALSVLLRRQRVLFCGKKLIISDSVRIWL